MQKSLLIALLILPTWSSFGQKIRFSDPTNTWKVFSFDYGPPTLLSDTTLHMYRGDTIIHSQTYLVLDSNNFIREDMLHNKVYILINDIEQVYMDYNLTLGDTSVHWNSAHDTFIYYVTNMDSALINGLYYKVWEFSPTSVNFGASPYLLLEGIGCVSGPLFINYPIAFFKYLDLTCFTNKGVNPVITSSIAEVPIGPFNNTTSCYYGDTLLKTMQISAVRGLTSVLPNPITQSSIIQLPCTIPSGRLTITNTLGLVITQTSFQNKQELPIGDLIKSPGIYFYRVTDDSNGDFYSGKFVQN